MKQNKIYYFALGRNAIYAVLKLLNISEGDEVLTPAWDCDGALEPFRARKCKLVFYKTDPYTFEADLNDLVGLITPGTRLIHLINHFGHPQNWDAINQIKKKYNIPLLEDNAYSLFSKSGNREFGSFGDFSIFSLRKNLPLPDGALLRINADYTYYPNKKSRIFYPPEFGRLKDLTVSKLKQTLGLTNFSFSRLFYKNKPYTKYLPPLYSDEETNIPQWERGKVSKDFGYDFERPMSGISCFLYNLYSVEKIDKITGLKRKYYKYLTDNLQGIPGIIIINKELKEGVVPFCFSILVNKNRDKILNKLLSLKYPVMAWPTLPQEVISKLDLYPDVEDLGKKVLQINLNNFKNNYLEQLIKDIKKIISK